MKAFITIFTITFIVLPYYLNAQHTFEKMIISTEDQIINSIIEDINGNYVMVGRIKNNNTSHFNGYLLRIDSEGNLIQNEEYGQNDTSACGFFNIHYFNNYYFFLGSYSINSTLSSKLWYMKLNANLEIEDEKLLNVPNDRWFSYMNSIIDSDSNFIITGYTTRYDNSNNYNNDAFFYKLDLDGDSLNSNFLTSNVPLYFSFDIAESNDSSQYYAFVSHFESTSGGQKLILNKDLDSIAIDPIPMGIYDFYSPTYISETEVLLCGKGSPGQSELYALNAISINDQTELIDYNHFEIGGNMREHPAMFNGVSKNENDIYIGGTSNLDYYNPFWSTFDSWFHLIKINPDISPVWEYWYGGDAYYFLYNILATSDGGCIMVGSRYDYETQNQERDIYIAKVNSEGLIVWTQEIPVGKKLATIYPNPGTNLLNIKTKNNELNFELIDATGKVLISKQLYSIHETLNTESIKTGVYFYRLTDQNNKIHETGKWIKK